MSSLLMRAGGPIAGATCAPAAPFSRFSDICRLLRPLPAWTAVQGYRWPDPRWQQVVARSAHVKPGRSWRFGACPGGRLTSLTEPEGAVSILGLESPGSPPSSASATSATCTSPTVRGYPRNGFTAKDCDRHSAKLAKGLLDALREVEVDHLVVTGDLTLSSETREFERAADMLKWWAAAGKLTVVPGNHDVWTADAVDTGRFLRAIGPDGKGMRRPAPTYPHVVPLGEVVLVAPRQRPLRRDADPRPPAGSAPTSCAAPASSAGSTRRPGRPPCWPSTTTWCCRPSGSRPTCSVARMPLADADQVDPAGRRAAGRRGAPRPPPLRLPRRRPRRRPPHAGPLRRVGLARRRRAGAARPRLRLRLRRHGPEGRRGAGHRQHLSLRRVGAHT